jgi:DNA end-binding protein Ku
MARSKRTGPRASWKGTLRIDLVSFEVQAVNAVQSGGGEYHFHQLHKECHSRIHYQKVCPIHGDVASDEIVLGYEYKKNKYVEIDPDELDEMRTKADRELRLDTFIDPAELDPMFYDGRTYMLMPARDEARQPYAVVCAALEKMDRFGIGQVIFSEREQLAAVRPKDGTLLMSMLHYAAEFREIEELRPAKTKVQAKEMKLAELLINASTESKFDLADYHDTYEKKIEQYIEKKLRGEEVVSPEDEEEETGVINLMDALKKSVDKAKGHKTSGKGHAARHAAAKTKGRATARRRKRAS